MEGVINPNNNKDKGSGFLLTTYATSDQVYRIDTLPSTKLVPTLKCVHPCQDCMESTPTNCLSCWTQDFSSQKYFVQDAQNQGTCKANCPAGQTRDNADSYVCINCDVSCQECKDENKSDCTICAENFPFQVSGTSHCL